MKYLHLIRFPNLLIVAATQYILEYLILRPAFLKADVAPILDHFQFGLLVLVTVLIAAGGYVINDIADEAIDKINKPEKMLIGKEISRKVAWTFYVILLVTGLLISIYLSLKVPNSPLILYPIACAGLAWYALHLKKLPLAGNLIVSLFCAFVAGIVFYAERTAFFEMHNAEFADMHVLEFLAVGYLIFGFLSTLFREVIKDLEDVKGDQQLNCKTLPIVFGIKLTKYFTAIIGLILIGFSIYFWAALSDVFEWDSIILMTCGVLLPVSWAVWKLFPAKSASDFHRLSQLAKIVMLAGLLLLITIGT